MINDYPQAASIRRILGKRGEVHMSCTLRDIAEKAGVSTVTVHKSIHGKPGISDKTRQRVLRIVEAMNYSVNPVASSLKREVITIAVITPHLEDRLSHFFRDIDAGIRKAEHELRNFRVTVAVFPCGESWQEQADILDDLAMRDDIHGVVIYCWDDTRLNDRFDTLRLRGKPVVTFHADAVNSCRIACVTAPDEKTGRLAAEVMGHIVPENKRVIVLGGNKMLKVLRDKTLGFYDYLQRHRPDLSLLEINDLGSIENLQAELEKVLPAFNNIGGIYCNSGRNGVPLCEVVHKIDMAGRVKVICSDVYAEMKPYFENGTITATLWQDTQSKPYNAIHLMYEYLTSRRVAKKLCTVRIGIVMKSNFDDYL